MLTLSRNATGLFGRICQSLAHKFSWDGNCILFFGEYPFPEE